eukprot:3420300-Prymnesium_polylepis.1
MRSSASYPGSSASRLSGRPREQRHWSRRCSPKTCDDVPAGAAGDRACDWASATFEVRLAEGAMCH